MKLAFYRAKRASRRKLLARTVDFVTGGYGYSHVELIFSDGISFSSSDREGGVRFREIDYDPSRWVIIDYPISPRMESYVRSRAESINGKKYDYLGIFFYHLLPLGVQSSNRWWCNEAIEWVMFFWPFRHSPNRFAQLMGLKPAKEYP